MDIGCGSGRLHLRYGVKTTNHMYNPQIHAKAQNTKCNCELMYDQLLAKNLVEVWGIDFSSSMIGLAKESLTEIGLYGTRHLKMTLEEGSAFELKPESGEHIPILVCLVNSIGVMQGPSGAVALFKSMKKAVEQAGGIAIISCYQKEYLESYGLNQYESTMDVSGQPVWMVPDTYASNEYLKRPLSYKRSFSNEQTISVNVYGNNGDIVQPSFTLERHSEKTDKTLESGHIQTHSGYESNWYSYDQVEEWIKTHWGKKTYHIKTKRLDALRAEPAQLAILDCGGYCSELFKHWEVL